MPGPATTVRGSGHGWLFAVTCRICSTSVGAMCGLFLLLGVKSPYWLMISAATPAVFGVAIDVPWTNAYGQQGGAPATPVHCSTPRLGSGNPVCDPVDDQAPRT